MKVGQSDGTTKDEMVLTGRSVTQLLIANSVQIRDTVSHLFPGNVAYSALTLIDATNHGEKGFFIQNTHDQAITVYIHGDMRQIPVDTTTRTIIANAVSVAAGASRWFGSTEYPPLKESIPYVAMQVTAAVTPISGSIKAYYTGVPR